MTVADTGLTMTIEETTRYIPADGCSAAVQPHAQQHQQGSAPSRSIGEERGAHAGSEESRVQVYGVRRGTRTCDVQLHATGLEQCLEVEEGPAVAARGIHP